MLAPRQYEAPGDPGLDTQYRRILVPLDGSDIATSAISVAKVLGRLFNSELTLITVLPEKAPQPQTVRLPETAGRNNLRTENTGIQRRAASYLRYVADELNDAGLRTSLQFPINSDVATEIVLTARDTRSQMIVMATRGRSGLTIGLLSSVTDRVIHSSSIPVLIVPRFRDAWMPEVVVVPLDGSELSEKSLPHVESICREAGASIVLLRTVTIPTNYGRDPYGGLPTALLGTEKEEALARQYLDMVATRLRARGFKVEVKIRIGHPRTQVTQFAQDIPCVLLVITTRGASGLTRWPVGSIADAVIRTSGVPVLVIPPEIDS